MSTLDAELDIAVGSVNPDLDLTPAREARVGDVLVRRPAHPPPVAPASSPATGSTSHLAGPAPAAPPAPAPTASGGGSLITEDPARQRPRIFRSNQGTGGPTVSGRRATQIQPPGPVRGLHQRRPFQRLSAHLRPADGQQRLEAHAIGRARYRHRVPPPLPQRPPQPVGEVDVTVAAGGTWCPCPGPRLCPRRRHGDGRMAGLGHQGGRIGPAGFEDHAGTIGQLRESALPIPRAGCGSGGPGRRPSAGLAAPWPGIRRALTGSGPSATEIFRFIG